MKRLAHVLLFTSLVFAFAIASVWAAEPKLVISITSGGGTTVCDTNCTVCTVGSGECVDVTEEDLLICRPLSSGLPITSCDWEVFFDGDSVALQLESQLRALEVAPNGNLALVTLNDNTVPGIGTLLKTDIALFEPIDVLSPYVGGPAYDDGAFKLYLNGDLTQQEETTKPWDAIELLTDGICEVAITADDTGDHSCPIVGSLTGGSGGAGLGGVHFNNEDLLRCTPSGFAVNGTVEACDYAMFLDASDINGVGNGVTTDIEAIDFLSFDQPTMTGLMVFKKAGGSPPGFPAHDNGRDLLLYDGTFGAGLCDISATPCAGDSDCPGAEVCDTGTCTLTVDSCATDADCSGAGNACTVTRLPAGTVTKYFDGVAVGLSGAGQKIEAFSIVPDGDEDDIPDGADNCPDDINPPTVCTDGASCPSGLSSECNPGEFCVQADADGDGVGDVCDQCNGRDDAVCFCGDSIVDTPSEQCDLGASNGAAGSPCESDCTIMGACTTSGAACTTAADCPIGEGCCGNNIVEVAEACDDGNVIENDTCDSFCMGVAGIPILGCEDLTGPNIIPAFVKVSLFKDTKHFPDFNRWKTKGDFNFANGLPVQPDSDDVRVVFNNTTTGELFSSTLAPASCTPSPCFVESGTPPKSKWKFLDKEADVPGAPSWRKGKLTQKENKIKFLFDGRAVTLFTAAEAGVPAPVRQTVRIGDACITTTLACEVKGNGKTLKCASTP